MKRNDLKFWVQLGIIILVAAAAGLILGRLFWP